MSASQGEELLRLESVSKHFAVHGGLRRRRTGQIHAVEDVSLSLRAGETLGLVGESGCGKSTLARIAVRLLEPTSGRIVYQGEDITHQKGDALRAFRRHVQIVFQDPYASLNPRMSLRDLIAEPLRIHGLWKEGGEDRVAELIHAVGLHTEHRDRYPHEFSGGQRQRIGIARALALNPRVLVLDEPVSALDVSIQAQIVNLLHELQERLGLAYLFIAHDLSVVRHISNRIAVMYLGRVVETGTRSQVYGQATHPYTQALLSAAPVPNPSRAARTNRIVLSGEVPNPLNPPTGCAFHTRCPIAQERCATELPELIDRFGHGHPAACHYAAPLNQG